MAKAKKEFKARVRKMQKHVKALIDLAATEQQREALYRVQGEADLLQSTLDREFEEPKPDLAHEELERHRADPRSIAS